MFFKWLKQKAAGTESGGAESEVPKSWMQLLVLGPKMGIALSVFPNDTAQ